MSDDTTRLTAGVDAGSSTVKVAIVRTGEGQPTEVLATGAERIRRRHTADVVDALFTAMCQQASVEPDAFHYVASTGDGEVVSFRHGHFYSMTTHARGALFLCPEADAVLDVGSLHARAIRVDSRGKVMGHRMTSQCASGSGQFLENIARYLGVPLEDVGPLSLSATQPETVSSICAVLAETDVINMVSRGIDRSDILKGIHLSISGRLARLLRAVGAREVVLLTGGLSHDKGLLAALEEQLNKPSRSGRKAATLDVRTDDRAILAGALGAALLGAYRYGQLERAGRLDSLFGVSAA